MDELKPNVIARLASMFTDHVVMTIVVVVFFVPGVISGVMKTFELSHEYTPMFTPQIIYIGLIGFALYICKDAIGGRSVGKRILKLQVIDSKTGKAASPFKCFVRNLLIGFLPLEVIMVLINPSSRIGDKLAGTKVVTFNPEQEKEKVNGIQIVGSILLAYGLLLVLAFPVAGIDKFMENQKVHYVENSLNEELAGETEQLFSEELSEYLTADVRVYDKIEEEENLKYVSVILQLEEDFLSDEIKYGEIRGMTIPLLYTKFPKGSFIGQVRYVFQDGNAMQVRAVTIDDRLKKM